MLSVFEQFPDLKEVVDVFAEGVAGMLGDQLVGIYLQGSLATGDFDAFSDVDWIVVVDGDLSDEIVEALQAFHAELYGHISEWARHLEGSYFPRELLADPSRSGEELWFLDHGSRKLVRSDHCNTIVVRWVLRHQAIAFVGPPTSELMPPISAEMLRADVAQTIVEWGRDILADPAPFNNQFYQAFIVQSYCRMRHTLAVGEVGSKRAGTEWAKRTLDPRWHALIDQSWAVRGDAFEMSERPADPDAFAATLAFVAEAIAATDPAFSQDPEQVRAQMRTDLLAARKARNADEVAILRTLLAALDHAEAVEVEERSNSAEPVVGQLNEMPRRQLSWNDVAQILRQEADDLRQAIVEFEQANRPEKVAQLNGQLTVVVRYLADVAVGSALAD